MICRVSKGSIAAACRMACAHAIVLCISTGSAALASQPAQESAERAKLESKPCLLAPVGDFVRNSIVSPEHPFELVSGRDPNGWTFSIAPYLWAGALDGTVGIGRAPEMQVNAKANKLLQNLNWGVAAFGEVRKGRWGLLADGYYADLSASQDLGGVFYKSGSLSLQQAFASLALACRIIDDRRGFLDVYAGARYNYLGSQVSLDVNPAGIEGFSNALGERMALRVKQVVAKALAGRADEILKDIANGDRRLREALRGRISGHRFDASREAIKRLIKAEAAAQLDPSAANLAAAEAAKGDLKKTLAADIGKALPRRYSLSQWWVDPITGLRAQVNFTRWLYLTTQADVGGFGAGSQITWNAMAALGVNFTRNVFGELGYRYMYVDYSRNSLLYEMNTFGLIGSIGVKF